MNTYNIIHTKKAPNCIGPYVQAIQINNIVFISGQIGICPKTGKIPNTIEQQTHQVLKNIKEILIESKLNIYNIIKTTIFMTDINHINKVNTIYQNFFSKNHKKYPTRSCVEVKKLPKKAKIKIEAIATTLIF